MDTAIYERKKNFFKGWFNVLYTKYNSSIKKPWWLIFEKKLLNMESSGDYLLQNQTGELKNYVVHSK